MMKILVAMSAAALVACGSQAHLPTHVPGTGDAAFKEVADRFLARYLQMFPVDATQLGAHDQDGRWPALGAEGDRALKAFMLDTRADLATVAKGNLGDAALRDRALIENQLAKWSFQLDSLHPWVRDPLRWTSLIGEGLDPLVTREFASHEARMESLRQRLAGLPAVVAAARATLAHPARVATETALQQAQGLVSFVETSLPAEFEREPAHRAELEQAAKEGLAALRDLVAFLKDDLLPRSDGDFRHGAGLFREELRFSLDSETPPDELYAAARATLEQTQEEMVATALELMPELFPGKPVPPAPQTHEEKLRLVRTVLDKLAEDHPTDATIVADTKKVIDEATAFVREKDLVEVPDEPLDVIEVPEYKRGVAVGYCESSGPLEKKKETFVAISPTPKDWSPERVASFYREYNRSMVAEFAIHEAMPGHYLQIAHANKSSDVLAAVFSSGAFAEGWAVYGEWLMAKYGFGGARVRITRQKMMLRVAANAILDHDVHAGSLDRDGAMKLMMEEALQEEGEAAGKWRRAQLSTAQLSTYFYGFHEIMKIRQRAEAQPGFSERAFNDKLLSFGSPPPSELAHLVLGDPPRE